MITAHEAYTRVIFGPAFGKKVDSLVREAVKNRQLYFKLRCDSFPANLNIDDVLAGLVILGYTFERIENENEENASIVLGFNLQFEERGRKN